MGPMQNEFIKVESRNLLTSPKKGQEAAVLGQGMITRIGITGGAAPVEVGVEVSVNLIVAGTGIILLEAEAGPGAEAVVQVLVITENVVEENMMMMRGVDEVGLMEVLLLLDEVPVLGGPLPQKNHLHPGVEVLICIIPKNDQPPLKVSLLMAVVILEAHLHVMMLMINGVAAVA